MNRFARPLQCAGDLRGVAHFLAMAAEHSTVALYTADAKAWAYPVAVAKAQNWGEKRVQIRKPLDEDK